MDLMARIGGVHFSGAAADNGFVIAPDGWSGWDGVDTRRSMISRPGADGAFNLPGYLEPRLVTVSGEVLASTPTELAHFGAQLTGLLAVSGSTDVLSVDFLGSTTWARVARYGKPRFEVLGSTRRDAKFQFQFWAADPRKFGQTTVFPAGPVFHYGNFPASPVFEIVGPHAGSTIVGPDSRQIIITQSLSSGQTHRFDSRTGRLYRRTGAGPWELQVGGVLRADLWAVPPGVSVPVSFFGGTGSTLVTETWI